LPKVAAILQSKNDSSLMSHCLDVLDLLVDKIIIMDNHSEDDTTDIILDHRSDKILLEINPREDRNEGRDFDILIDMAMKEGCSRYYIVYTDEVPPPKDVEKMKHLLYNTEYTIRLARAELTYGQKSVYGLKGNGMPLISNAKGVTLNADMPIHISAARIPYQQVMINPHEVAPLHYGQGDYDYTIYKLLYYILLEKVAGLKSIDHTFNDYFKKCENFVESTNRPLEPYIWKGEMGLYSPIPYLHYMRPEIRSFCSTVDHKTEDIMPYLREFIKFDHVKQLMREQTEQEINENLIFG